MRKGYSFLFIEVKLVYKVSQVQHYNLTSVYYKMITTKTLVTIISIQLTLHPFCPPLISYPSGNHQFLCTYKFVLFAHLFCFVVYSTY